MLPAAGLVGFRQNLHEWAGEASLMHKPTGLWGQFAFSTSENDFSNAFGAFTGKHLPTEVGWDVALGIQNEVVGHRQHHDLGRLHPHARRYRLRSIVHLERRHHFGGAPSDGSCRHRSDRR